MNKSNKLVCLLILAIQVIYSQANVNLEFSYHNYDSLTSILKSYAAAYPTKTHLYSIGKSVQNRELWVLAIADSNPSIHVPLRPEAKYIGNMHGNEVPSKEVLFHLIDYMLKNQTQDESVNYIMKNIRVHIMLSMNPDGYETSFIGDCDGLKGRANANGYDLNRNFPDYFECNEFPMQPETEAVINWLNREYFVLSANFHGGTILANYPYDNLKNANGNPSYSPTKDDDVFRHLATTYSFNHATMRTSPCGGEVFMDGITNGADWYPVNGGMQDYNYIRFGCSEILLEISCCKFPSTSQLQQLFNDNKKSLIEYLKLANTGVRGIITFPNGELAQNVTVKVNDREPYFKTNKYGEYYRILLPGTYNLTLMLNCGYIYSTSITISNSTNLLEKNITLPIENYQLYKTLSNGNLDRYAIFCSRDKQPVSCSDRDLISSAVKTFPFKFLTIFNVFYLLAIKFLI